MDPWIEGFEGLGLKSGSCEVRSNRCRRGRVEVERGKGYTRTSLHIGCYTLCPLWIVLRSPLHSCCKGCALLEE